MHLGYLTENFISVFIWKHIFIANLMNLHVKQMENVTFIRPQQMQF